MQVAFNFITALNPASPTFDESNQRDVRKRPAGGVQKPSKVCCNIAQYNLPARIVATHILYRQLLGAKR